MTPRQAIRPANGPFADAALAEDIFILAPQTVQVAGA